MFTIYIIYTILYLYLYIYIYIDKDISTMSQVYLQNMLRKLIIEQIHMNFGNLENSD